MKHSESISSIAKAVCAMQATMKPAAKDLTNPAFNSKYSDINAVWDTLRDPLTDNSMCLLQDITNDGNSVACTTTLVHVSGEWFSFGPFCVTIQKNTSHGIGSATSYAKRYALCAALGITSGDHDDDGNENSDENFKNKEEKVFVNDKECTFLVDIFQFLNPIHQKIAVNVLHEYKAKRFDQLLKEHYIKYSDLLISLREKEEKEFEKEVSDV